MKLTSGIKIDSPSRGLPSPSDPEPPLEDERNIMKKLGLTILLWHLLVTTTFAEPPKVARQYDVVVYGGTSAGVVAAVQAARMHKRVALIEPTSHVGGLSSAGLGFTDTGDKRVIGGVAREFYQRIKRHYDSPQAWRFGRRDQYAYYRADADAMWTFEPHVAEATFDQMLSQHSIDIVRGQRLNRDSGVELAGQQIVAITTERQQTFRGKMFIDATYEGDLMAAAGVTYTIGRESNSKYNEALNGVQTKQNIHNHRFLHPVDPFVKAGDPDSGLLPGIHDDSPGEEGQGDHRVQAYCFRMCMSNVPENRVPFAKPDDYDPAQFELLLRNFEAGDHRVPLHWLMMPNGKTDTNNNGAVSTDFIGMNYSYPEASYQQREEIVRAHLHYQQGLMWTLSNHPRVPKSVRDAMSVWGMAKDEFVTDDHWPHLLYIREARRMVSDLVMSEQDCLRKRIVPDSVGLGSYNMDSHNTQRYVNQEGFSANEGDVQVSPQGTYLISYRSIVPARGEVTNLLVPVCLSSSHIAYGSIRMEPVFMILGQSAATAAVLSIEQNCTVQTLKYPLLRRRLIEDGQVLDLPKR